jgi:hypothetical protein
MKTLLSETERPVARYKKNGNLMHTLKYRDGILTS